MSRTNPNVIFFRFIMMGMPVVLVLALLFGSDGGLALAIGFLVAMTFVFFGIRAITIVFTNLMSPPGDDTAYKQGGGDYFYDSLGAPLNFDSDQIRQGHIVSQCPHCGMNRYVMPNQDMMCGTTGCGAMWADNRWWMQNDTGWWWYWTENGWVPNPAEPEEDLSFLHPEPQHTTVRHQSRRRN